MGLEHKKGGVPAHDPPRDDKAAFPITYHDKYVIHYDFSDLGQDEAVAKLKTLCEDLSGAGLEVEVRRGNGQSLLVFARARKEHLDSTVFKSRVKDWLWAITRLQPPTGKQGTLVDDAFEAENVLSMYHLVNWPQEIGGAGITPGRGKWECVRSIFPIHNEPANSALLRHLSKKLFLGDDDLDSIRDLFGSKVAFYFAFMQSYAAFLFFPAITGFLAWMFLPKYSLTYAILVLFGCTIFLEYWKIRQIDLSIRWDVKGVGSLKVSRPTFRYEKVVVDAVGRTKHIYPKWKAVLRQLVQVPFFVAALLVLGSIITAVFAIEVLVSEAYDGPYQNWLEYLPTVLLAISLPYINTFLEDVAEWLAEFENHRTSDSLDVSLTQKRFVLSFIANYLPILLTAFVYIPMGDLIMPQLRDALRKMLGRGTDSTLIHIAADFRSDPDRLHMFEELIFPWIKIRLRDWWHDRQTTAAAKPTSHRRPLPSVVDDDPAEVAFLRRVRQQADLEPYNVQDDISEMAIQFGHLALFAPAWPLVSVGFLINDWIELRSDFLKLCTQHQRPHPIRTDGIGPWTGALDSLAWLGSISTAAIVHMFSGGGGGRDFEGKAASWLGLLATIFVSEHIYLLLRVLVHTVLQRVVGSKQLRREKDERYAFRKRHLDELEAQSKMRDALLLSAGGGGVEMRRKRSDVRMADLDRFWTKQALDGKSEEVGAALIRAARTAGEKPDSEVKMD
ncbi:hypothetical protein DHEL01_v210957 [Diaporthe helianthi]|uniref:Plasma membrane channel protein n=1 Tax=Diaporthe helianthi TaxID=158607 RepID=A0A2P5HK80_DIAHE|nr:hypothetical protein DHEL01_v210957 [Diaporthe helianthi]